MVAGLGGLVVDGGGGEVTMSGDAGAESIGLARFWALAAALITLMMSCSVD